MGAYIYIYTCIKKYIYICYEDMCEHPDSPAFSSCCDAIEVSSHERGTALKGWVEPEQPPPPPHTHKQANV